MLMFQWGSSVFREGRRTFFFLLRWNCYRVVTWWANRSNFCENGLLTRGQRSQCNYFRSVESFATSSWSIFSLTVFNMNNNNNNNKTVVLTANPKKLVRTAARGLYMYTLCQHFLPFLSPVQLSPFLLFSLPSIAVTTITLRSNLSSHSNFIFSSGS